MYIVSIDSQVSILGGEGNLEPESIGHRRRFSLVILGQERSHGKNCMLPGLLERKDLAYDTAVTRCSLVALSPPLKSSTDPKSESTSTTLSHLHQATVLANPYLRQITVLLLINLP